MKGQERKVSLKMKIKKKKIGIFITVLVISIAVITYSFKNVNATNDFNTEIPFTKNGCFKQMDDNWIYYFDILNYKNEKYYVFDGYNTKYIFLEDYSIKMIDPETKEVTEKIVSETPILSRSDKFGNEIVEINEYFNQKQFSNIITHSDLVDLKTNFISKDLLIEMFNNTIQSKVETNPGKYINFSHLGKVIEDSLDNKQKGKWELTYINDYGYLKYVTIDFVFENGTYLSDNPQYSLLLNELENNIEEKQSFKNVSTTGFNQTMSTDLYNLLNKAQENVSL